MFFKKAEPDIRAFLERKGMEDVFRALKKHIKRWYERLNGLYEFEKVSVLYGVLKNGDSQIAEKFGKLELVEELLEILKGNIEIAYDDIALIIYKGSKEDLPELFKNINTGSVALSQYEILQSVWNDFLLEKNLVSETYEAFGRELELIRKDYEIDAVKEAGVFDIFKNIVGLNHMICCREDCDVIFKFAGFKRISQPKVFESGIRKYYDNDSIAFEIYSTVLCNAPNQIVRAIDSVYKNDDNERISRFINQLNQVIIEAVDDAIEKLKGSGKDLLESKYHALYILAGIIFSKYDIDVNQLTVKQTKMNKKIYDVCMDIERHKRDKWFVGKNRQVGFFNIKIEELRGMKRDDSRDGAETDGVSPGGGADILKIRIGDVMISANTVKEFYRRIFAYLIDKFDIDGSVPYATGRKRYLVSRTKHHINGDLFVSPIKVGEYYIETHKSRNGTLRDVYNYMKKIGIDVSYAE